LSTFANHGFVLTNIEEHIFVGKGRGTNGKEERKGKRGTGEERKGKGRREEEEWKRKGGSLCHVSTPTRPHYLFQSEKKKAPSPLSA
jgi:hypothetical protein